MRSDDANGFGGIQLDGVKDKMKAESDKVSSGTCENWGVD